MNSKKGLALIIANAIYDEQNNIESCTKDGIDMIEKFKSMKFDIIDGINLSRNNFFQKIEEFIDVSKSYQNLVFYYSGHGVQIDGNNYLVPKDCVYNRNKNIFINSSLIDLNIITNFMDEHQSKTNIIILDACRNNPFHTKGLNTLGLAELNVGSGTFVSFATAPNSTSGGYGTAEYNSIFTKFLLKHIDKPNLKIEDMFKLVRNDVENYTSKEQIPWESTSLKTDFCFNTMSDNEIDETIYKLVTNFDTVNSLVLLSDYLRLPISNIMRRYQQYKSNLPGGIYFTNQLEFEEFILKNILDLGFKIKNYRWVYNDTSVIMGEFYHDPNTFKNK